MAKARKSAAKASARRKKRKTRMTAKRKKPPVRKTRRKSRGVADKVASAVRVLMDAAEESEKQRRRARYPGVDEG